jgi:hypothetical protein
MLIAEGIREEALTTIPESLREEIWKSLIEPKKSDRRRRDSVRSSR